MSDISIGTARPRPGQVTHGWLEGTPLPTGAVDHFPVVIAQGHRDGPCFWLTTGVHGTEHTGLIVLQEFLSADLARRLRGTVIAMLSLNPSGLRTKQRTAYSNDGDPNRLFPKPAAPPRDTSDAPDKPLSDLENAYKRIHDLILETQPAALLDLHNASIGSLPFALRDPVFYYQARNKSPGRKQAEALQERVGDLAHAIGLTIIDEYAADAYTKKNLDRSVSGSVLNHGGVPALTLELGSWMFVDPGIVAACQAGLRNALRWAGMLDDAPEPVVGIPIIDPGYRVRRSDGPYAPETGIVHHMVRPGELFTTGQPLARVTDIFGQPLGADDGLIRSTEEGFVYGWSHGVVHYRGQTIMGLAVRHNGEMFVPHAD